VLKLDKVIHDNLFDLGEHSLLAFNVLARVAKEFKIELPRRVLFRGARMLAELEVASYVE
jgi:hypothetical protein